MGVRQYRTFVGDFETTVYKNQTSTEVWASAVVELGTEEVFIHHSIQETFMFLTSMKTNIRIYYHNLKFDGVFWLDYFLKNNFIQAYEKFNEDGTQGKFLKDFEMPNKSIKYSISDMGQFYTITVKYKGYFIEFRDSLKLLPFKVKEIGKAFKTKHQKLEMEYNGFRYAGCNITNEEKQYIANDVLVVKEALEMLFSEGHNKLTIGSCCLSEFKKTFDSKEYDFFFPNVYELQIDETKHTYKTAGKWIHKTYRGGWCYLVKSKANKKFTYGCTFDVNSLYPSMMHSQSGNRYPVGKPHFWIGNIPDEALQENHFYFVHVRTRFYLKKGFLPFIQIKSNWMYSGTESLETSDWFHNGKYHKWYHDEKGNLKPTTVDLYLTMMDFELIKKHYELVDYEEIDGCWFDSEIGLFDWYIDKYKKQKMGSKGAKRTLAKLYLNNLYGKMAASMESSFKVAYLKNDAISFMAVHEEDKKPGYIPIGSAITSYARCFTIKAAQANYHWNKRGFIYADTDSIHCDLNPEEVKGVTIHPSEFCCWKAESNWDFAIFARQKTYIEHITHEDNELINKPYYNIKCAGMPEHSKDLFEMSITGISNWFIDGYDAMCDELGITNYSEAELNFLSQPRTLEDFKLGLEVPGKLLPKRIPGGVLLVDTPYKMRK